MIQEPINPFSFLVDIARNLLLEISEVNIVTKPLPNKWSKKEILGHLI